MKKQSLTGRQATMWFILYQLGTAILLLPGSLASTAKQDAWLVILLAIGAYLLLTPLYIAIAVRIRETTFSDYFMLLFGQVGGRILLGGFVLGYPFLLYVLVLRDLSEFLTTSVLSDTPDIAVSTLMIAAVIYVVRSGPGVVGRSAEILFFFVLLLFTLGFASLLPSSDWSNLLPVLEYGWKPVVLTSISLLTFPYTETVLFLFLMPQLRQPNRLRSAVLKSAMISGFLFLILTLLTLTTLSEGVVSNLTYPSYFAVRTISIGDFYERFEILVAVMWYIAIYFRLALILYVSAEGLAVVLKLRDSRPLLVPLSLIALIMSSFIWPNKSSYLSALQVWPFYSMIFGILLPLLIWTVGFFKKPSTK